MSELLAATHGVKTAEPLNGFHRLHKLKNGGAVPPSEQFRVVSYFAGCGGMDLGFLGGFNFKGAQFKRQPFEIARAYDFASKCVETYKMNISDDIEEADLNEVSPKVVPKADVLIGGFPCQDFSSCGPKRGLTSARGKLYRAMVDYMEHHRPAVVVGENVPHLARIHSGNVMKRIISDLEDVGYRVYVWDLYAPDFGIPQRRSRLFFVCVRDDVKGAPTRPLPEYTAEEYRSIDWAIADLIPVSDETVPNQSQYFLASKAKKGNGQGDEKSKKGQPAYTVRANAKSRVQFHYSLNRRLTVRECARLQTFPDSFVFPHSATTNIMQIGNAVPPVLAFKVASSVANFLRSNATLEATEGDSVLIGNY
jgi:DNA (cytosine-5)-methyltransferase 1